MVRHWSHSTTTESTGINTPNWDDLFRALRSSLGPFPVVGEKAKDGVKQQTPQTSTRLASMTIFFSLFPPTPGLFSGYLRGFSLGTWAHPKLGGQRSTS